MDNGILELIKTRRSIRRYQQRQITSHELDMVLEAGTYAPSGRGAQSATIVVVQDASLIAKLSRLNASVMGVDKDPYFGAPTLLFVFGDGTRATHVQDASCVLMTLMLAAHSLGLGTCWVNREKEMFSLPEGQELVEKWGLGDTVVGVGALSVGYPEGEPGVPAPRKPGYIVTA